MRLFKLFTIMAFAVLISACTASAESLSNEIEKGKKIMKAGDFRKSAEFFNNLLTQKRSDLHNHPKHAETWYLFSVSLRRLGRTNLADKALERAKKLKEMANTAAKPAAQSGDSAEPDGSKPEEITDSPDNRDADQKQNPVAENKTSTNVYDLASLKNEQAKEHFRKAASFQEAGQLQASAEEFLKAIDKESGNAELMEKALLVLNQLGGNYYIKAQAVYNQLEKVDAVKLSVTQKIAQARANTFSGKPDLKKAEKIINDILAQQTDLVEAIIVSAQIDVESKRYKQAIEKFNKAIKLDKESMTAFLGLGEAYQKMKQFDKAIEILKQARGMWPNSFMPLVSLGKAYHKNSEIERALLYYKLAQDINANSFDVNLGLLEIFAGSGDYRATRHLNICEALVAGDPRVDFWKAVFMELDERPQEALKIYSVLALYSDEAAYKGKLRLGQIYAGIGHETFPGNKLVEKRPGFMRTYQRMINQELGYYYLSQFIEKNPDAKESVKAKRWLNENEESLHQAREVKNQIQNLFVTQ